MTRRTTPKPPAADDIVLTGMVQDIKELHLVDELNLPHPIDLVQQLREMTGKRDGAELSGAQVKQLWNIGRKVAQHRRPDMTALVLTDDFMQTLVVMIKPKAALHFAFFANFN